MISGLLIDYLLRQARGVHKMNIQPAGNARNWSEAITECKITNTITLWYNIKGDKSTHNIVMKKGSKDESNHED